MADLRDFTGKNRKFTGTTGIVPSSTTAETANRVNETGRLRFNSTTNLMEYYNGVTWIVIDAPPAVTSVTGTINESDFTSTLTINGTNFSLNCTAVLINNNAVEIAFTSLTRVNSTELTAVLTNSNLGTIADPYKVKVINASGLSSILESAISVNQSPIWSTSAGSLGTVVKDVAISTITLTATDPESGDIDYFISSGSLPTGLTLNSETGEITGTYTGSTATTFNFTVQAYDTASNFTARSFSITSQIKDGSTPALAVAKPNDLYTANNSFSDGLYYINTPDGGVQQCYCINIGGRGWALVGRYAADAMNTVQDTLGSVRALKDVTQGGTSTWSADFGTFDITDSAHKLMAWGSPNFPAKNSSGVNWVFNIPQTGYTTFRQWMANAPSDSPSQGTPRFTDFNTYQGPFSGLEQKQGIVSNGASDGPFKGVRWTNTAFRATRFADAADGNYVSQGGLSTPQGSVWYMDGTQDAKWSVHATNVVSGQDTTSSQYFGIDDDVGPGHYDAGTGSEGEGSSRRDFSNAVTFWLT